MRSARILFLLVALAFTPIAGQEPAGRAFTPDDWYRLTTVSSPAMSPDGRLVAFTVRLPALAEPAARGPDPRGELPRVARQGSRVLVVDDNVPSVVGTEHESLDALRTAIRENLSAREQHERRMAHEEQVVNAVVDAIRSYGVNDVQMPCTPERVWRAINDGSAGGGTTGAAAPHFDASTGMSGTVDRAEGDVQ